MVTEGFAGNIALKTAEGTARQVIGLSSRGGRASRCWRASASSSRRGAFGKLAPALDPRRANGGAFLGLNGIVIKSHGGTDAEGFAAAIEIGYSMAASGVVESINKDLMAYRDAPSQAASDQTSPRNSPRRVRCDDRPFGRARRRRVPAGKGPHQRRPRHNGRYVGRMDPASAPASASATSPPRAN